MRTGRHARPSQVQNVAETAYKAAPAMAIAGVLIAAPQAHADAKVAARSTTIVEQVHGANKVPDRGTAGATALAGQIHTDALVVHHEQSRHYTVRPGDTLSSIAQRFYGNPADWTWLWHVNESVVRNPNSIYAGEVLKIPADPPADAAHYAPKHAKTSTTTTLTSSATKLSGTLNCSGLEALWEAAGGSHGEAFMAAEIAEAESGGNQYALSPTNDYGYWQINGSHGPAMATFNPMGNAKAAIAISDNGRDWGAWTTYTSGAYAGRC